jgi:uncharacterized protein
VDNSDPFLSHPILRVASVQELDGRLVVSPTDLVGHLACAHLTQLERRAALGELVRPERVDPELDIVRRHGLEHETEHLATLVEEGRSIVVIEKDKGLDGLEAAARETCAAMARGVDVVYQATFFDGTWLGYADFLEKVDTPSALGPWSYEPVDTKLARRVKAAAVLQLCEYARAVAAIQGVAPAHVHVVTGDRQRHTIKLADAAAYERRVRADLERAIRAGTERTTYPEPCNHCGLCRWYDDCLARRRADDHLSLVAGLRRDQDRKLHTVGITTLTELAWSDPSRLDELHMSDAAKARLHAQARLQLQQRATGETVYELADVDEGRGLSLLPKPSPGDVFFDIEGDPFVGDHGLEYLLGITTVDTGVPVYRAFWSHTSEQEKASFEELVDFLIARVDRLSYLLLYIY